MKTTYYINGSYVQRVEASIPVVDLGLTRGYGVFDYLRTYGGRPFHLIDHLKRFKFSAQKLLLELPFSIHEITDIIHDLLSRNEFPESSIKIILTGGVSSDQMIPCGQSTFCVLMAPFEPPCNKLLSNGIGLMTTPLLRTLPEAKTTNYISAILAITEAKKKGLDDALYIKTDGEILESTTSNFFIIKNKTLITSNSEDILFGITREVLLKIARDEYKIEERAIHKNELYEAEEAFICSSSREIMPVIQVDDIQIGNGVVKDETKRLAFLFQRYASLGNYPDLDILRYRI